MPDTASPEHSLMQWASKSITLSHNRGSNMSDHVLFNLLKIERVGGKKLNAKLAEHFISFSRRV